MGEKNKSGVRPMKTPNFEARYSTKQWKHDLIKISPKADKKLTWSVKINVKNKSIH